MKLFEITKITSSIQDKYAMDDAVTLGLMALVRSVKAGNPNYEVADWLFGNVDFNVDDDKLTKDVLFDLDNNHFRGKEGEMVKRLLDDIQNHEPAPVDYPGLDVIKNGWLDQTEMNDIRGMMS